MSYVGLPNPMYKNDLKIAPFEDYMKGGMVVGGQYRTKVANDVEKAKKAFVKSLMKKGYSEKGAKMLFGKEEKKAAVIKNTRGFEKRKKVAKDELSKLKVKELKALAKEKGVIVLKGTKKGELIELIKRKDKKGKKGGIVVGGDSELFDDNEGGIIVGGSDGGITVGGVYHRKGNSKEKDKKSLTRGLVKLGWKRSNAVKEMDNEDKRVRKIGVVKGNFKASTHKRKLSKYQKFMSENIKTLGFAEAVKEWQKKPLDERK